MNTPYATGSAGICRDRSIRICQKSSAISCRWCRNRSTVSAADADGWSKQQHGKVFAELTQQDALLSAFENGSAQFPQVPAKTFFAFLLQNTREGYFSDPIHGGNQGMVGWKLIGFRRTRRLYGLGRARRTLSVPVS